MADMNMMNLFTQLGFSTASPVSGTNILGINPMDEKMGAAGSPDGFMNLLDLVAHMDVAEAQDVGSLDKLSQELGQLKDTDLRAIDAQTNAALVSLQMSPVVAPQANFVGQQVLVKTNLSETIPVNELVTHGQILQAQGELRLKGAEQKVSAQSAEAVQAWALALVNDDLKSITVEESASFGPSKMHEQAQIEASPFEVLRPHVLDAHALGANALPKGTELGAAVKVENVQGTGDRVSQVDPQMGSEAVKGARAPQAALGTSSLPVQKLPVASEGKAPIANAASNAAAKANPVVASDRVMPNENVGKRESAEHFSDSNPSGKKTLSGSDFVLNHTLSKEAFNSPSTLAGAAAGVTVTSAIAGRDTLGKTEDNRISSQTLDFVAEKVETLKTQGGGTLRVELTPKGMGSIEIRVGMRNGQMDVRVLAESANTQKALDLSKTDLMSRLETVHPARLEVGALSSLTSGAFEATSSQHLSTPKNIITSEQFVGGLNGGASADRQAQQMQATTNGGAQTGSGFGRSDSGAFQARNFELGLGADTAQASKTTSFEARLQGSEVAKSESDRGQESTAFTRDDRREKAMDRWEEVFGQRKSA